MVFTSYTGVNELNNMAIEINKFLRDKKNATISYHNANDYVIATVTATS
jgi:hypothetical protein